MSEKLIKIILDSEGIEYIQQYQFDRKRKFRFDFALIKDKIAIEYEGGTYIKGGHVRGKVYHLNCEKYNLALLRGWKVLRYTVDDMQNPQKIIDDINILKEMV